MKVETDAALVVFGFIQLITKMTDICDIYTGPYLTDKLCQVADVDVSDSVPVHPHH